MNTSVPHKMQNNKELMMLRTIGMFQSEYLDVY